MRSRVRGRRSEGVVEEEEGWRRRSGEGGRGGEEGEVREGVEEEEEGVEEEREGEELEQGEDC